MPRSRNHTRDRAGSVFDVHRGPCCSPSSSGVADRKDPVGMVFIPGGVFRMGSDQHYPEEAPAHDVAVDGFWIDRTPVTNRDFLRFVKATGYVTLAELKPDPRDYPGALPHMIRA